MAGTAVTVTKTYQTPAVNPRGVVGQLVASLNAAVADLEKLRAVDAQQNTLVEELHDDHATNKTFTDELKTKLNAAIADITQMRTAINAIITAAATDIAAVAAVTPSAALTTSAVASSGAATLTASKPTSANVNAANDLTAFLIN